MKNLAPLLLVPAFAGCLTSTPLDCAEWSIPTEPCALKLPVSGVRADADFGIARLSQLVVRAPYDSRSIQVLRADKTLMPDPYNHFAAIPSQLLKGPVQDALGDSPRFTTIVASSSSVTTSHIVEVTVSKLQLDCSVEGSRKAEVELSILVLNRDREIVWMGRGSSHIEAKDGNYGMAFAEALNLSLKVAMGGR